MSSEAFVTLATNDGYALGALVLAQSIRKVGTKANLVVLISNYLSDLIKKSLETNFDEVIVVDQLNSNDIKHLNLLARPELGITFTKINCWLLEQYSKCVFLDSDCLVLRSIDHLFQSEELSAAPDAGWPDCFNSGVFVYRPSKDTFDKLMLFASQENPSFDGGDQGLLNAFFSNWRTGDISRHLPFTYNVTANAFYSYLPAVTRFRNDIHIVHFAGTLKPWQLTFNPENEQLSGNLGGQNEIQRDFLLSWWRILNERVWPMINQLNQQSTSKSNTINGEGEIQSSFIPSLNYANLTNNETIQAGSVAHRRAWEAGHIDYHGRDSFSNIEEQLQRNIQQKSYQFHPTQQKLTTLKSSSIETTPTNEQQTKLILQSSLKDTSRTNQCQLRTTSTALVQTSLKDIKTRPGEEDQPGIISQNVIQLPTTTTTININTSDDLSNRSTFEPVQTSFKQTTEKNIYDDIINERTSSSTNLLKTSSKEISPLSQTTSYRENTQTLLLSNENQSPPPVRHQSNWTVQSTIVTSYTQGVGELSGATSVSKVVSESSATSSSDKPMKEIFDSTNASGLKLTAKTSNDHLNWLFNKVFLAITYTISLCYLLFLVALRRPKNTDTIPGNSTTVRPSSTSGKRAKE